MSPDRTHEYLLVVEVRKRIGQISKNISDATQCDYIKKYERMKRTGKTPESAGSKKSYYAYRAALLYGIRLEAAGALKARDKSSFQSEEWQAAMQVLQRCKAVFDRYPPDPERIHQLSGSRSFTWIDVQAHPSNNLRNASSTIKSKKRVLTPLRKIEDWHGKLFEHPSSTVCSPKRRFLTVWQRSHAGLRGVFRKSCVVARVVVLGRYLTSYCVLVKSRHVPQDYPLRTAQISPACRSVS